MTRELLDWLLEGDPSIRWQVQRDLLKEPESVYHGEQKRMLTHGWAKRLLDLQDPDGMWGGGYYSPKWISTTYTLQLLRRMGLPPGHEQVDRACKILLDKGCWSDGGINVFVSLKHSETCVSGMVLGITSWFDLKDERIHALAGYLLGQQMQDGGWNCNSYLGHTHSSFHTTISVLEGLREYEKRFSTDVEAIENARSKAVEFLLIHSLYKSHRTGKVVDPRMTRLSFPPRWRYDILRALDHLAMCKVPFDPRMDDALEILRKKRLPDGRWKLQQKYAGLTFFDMESVGDPSRWNTLRGLRVLQWFSGDSNV